MRLASPNRFPTMIHITSWSTVRSQQSSQLRDVGVVPHETDQHPCRTAGGGGPACRMWACRAACGAVSGPYGRRWGRLTAPCGVRAVYDRGDGCQRVGVRCSRVRASGGPGGWGGCCGAYRHYRTGQGWFRCVYRGSCLPLPGRGRQEPVGVGVAAGLSWSTGYPWCWSARVLDGPGVIMGQAREYGHARGAEERACACGTRLSASNSGTRCATLRWRVSKGAFGTSLMSRKGRWGR